MHSFKHRTIGYIRNNWKTITILIGIVVAYWLLIVTWRVLETRPPHWDMGRHLWLAENYRQYIASTNISQVVLSYAYYPPMLYGVTGVWMNVFGTSLVSAVASNGLWIALLASSIYATTKRIATKQAGLYAVVFILTLPLMGSISRDFQIDMPMTAVLALNLYCLIRSEYFRETNWSVLYGITAGFGMLTKWSFLFVAPWPFLYVVIQSFLKYRGDYYKNMVLALLIANVICGPWYWHNIGSLKIDFIDNGFKAGIRENDPGVLSLRGFLYYPEVLLRYYLHVPWLIAVLGAMIAGFKRRAFFNGDKVIPLALIVGTVMTLTLLGNKDPRYVLPAIIGIAIYVGMWLDRCIHNSWRWAGVSIVMLMIISMIATWFFSSKLATIGGENMPIILWSPQGYITGSPTREVWCQESSIREAKKIGVNVAVETPDSIWFNAWGYQYYTLREGMVLTPRTSAEVLIGSGSPDSNIAWQCVQQNGTQIWVKNLR